MARAKGWPYGEEGTALGGAFADYNEGRPDYETTERQAMGHMANRRKHFDQLLAEYDKEFGPPTDKEGNVIDEDLDQYAKRIGVESNYENTWPYTKNFLKYIPGKNRQNEYLGSEFNKRYGWEDPKGERKKRTAAKLTQGLPGEEQAQMNDTVGEFFTPGNPYYNPIDFEELMNIYNKNKDYDNYEDY